MMTEITMKHEMWEVAHLFHVGKVQEDQSDPAYMPSRKIVIDCNPGYERGDPWDTPYMVMEGLGPGESLITVELV